LAEVVAGRTATSITFTWNEGFDNGGSPVYDYRLWIAAGDGEWQQLAEDITVTTYTATGLTAGITYRFRVEAQNAMVTVLSVMWFLFCVQHAQRLQSNLRQQLSMIR
jgi:hypothetical protein